MLPHYIPISKYYLDLNIDTNYISFYMRTSHKTIDRKPQKYSICNGIICIAQTLNQTNEHPNSVRRHADYIDLEVKLFLDAISYSEDIKILI